MVADIVYQLNAWSPERVDEPDYNARIEGFCAGKKLLSTTGIDAEMILPILNNALFYVLTVSRIMFPDYLHQSEACEFTQCPLPSPVR